MSSEILLFILVCAAAVALILQSYSMWQTSRSITAMVEQLQARSKELESDAQQVLGRVQGLLDSLAPLGGIAENLRENVEAITGLVAQRTQDLDRFAQEITEMGRAQASRVNHLITDTAQKFEQTTGAIQEEVLKPMIEVSSFLKGLKTGINYLFSRKEAAGQATRYPEEEMFI